MITHSLGTTAIKIYFQVLAKNSSCNVVNNKINSQLLLIDLCIFLNWNEIILGSLCYETIKYGIMVYFVPKK